MPSVAAAILDVFAVSQILNPDSDGCNSSLFILSPALAGSFLDTLLWRKRQELHLNRA